MDKINRLFSSFFEDRHLLLIVAASLLSIYIVSSSVGFTMGPDGNEYISSGFQLFQPQIYGRANTYIPPLYPIYLKLLFLLNNLFVFKLSHHYFMALLSIILFYLAIKPFSKSAAFIGALIFVFDFNAMIYFSLVSTESLYILCFCLLLFSLSRLIRDRSSLFNIYLFGLILFVSMLVRTAGMFLFIFLIPFLIFYFRSLRLLKHLAIAFLIPALAFTLIWNNINLVKFPKSMYLLFFAQYNQLLDYNRDANFNKLVDLTEKTYFTHRLEKSKKEVFIKDMQRYFTPASSILFYMGMSGCPEEMKRLISESDKEGIKNASAYKLFKNVFAMFLVFNKFNFLGEIYNLYAPLEYKNPSIAVEQDFNNEFSRYGGLPKKEFVDYRYKKYILVDNSILYIDKRNEKSLSIMFAINRKFILFFSFFVYFASLIFLVFNYKTNNNLALLSVFGLLVIIYSYLMSILPVAQERYRAVVDLFYFIPIGWMYSSVFTKKFWVKKNNYLFVILLLSCIFLNSLPMSSLFNFLRNVRLFLRLG